MKLIKALCLILMMGTPALASQPLDDNSLQGEEFTELQEAVIPPWFDANCLIRKLRLPPKSLTARLCPAELRPHAEELFSACRSGNFSYCTNAILREVPRAPTVCGTNVQSIAKAIYLCISEA